MYLPIAPALLVRQVVWRDIRGLRVAILSRMGGVVSLIEERGRVAFSEIKDSEPSKGQEPYYLS
jgi:hypothetical protein